MTHLENHKDRRLLVLMVFCAGLYIWNLTSPFTVDLRADTYTIVVVQPENTLAVYRHHSDVVTDNNLDYLFIQPNMTCGQIPARYALFFDVPLPVNKADLQSLQMLPGIGPGKAKKIVNFIQQNSKIKNSSTLLQIKGIGPKLASRLEPLLCFD